MKYTEWITYRDKTFLLVHLSKLSGAQLIEALEEYRSEMLAQKKSTPVLFEQNGAPISSFVNEFVRKSRRELIRYWDENQLARPPVAVVGSNRLVRIIMRGITTSEKVRFFDDAEAAKEWLYRNG